MYNLCFDVQVGSGFLGNKVPRSLVQAGLKSKEKSTLRVYFSNFKKWREYAFLKGESCIPANEDKLAEFLIEKVNEFSLPSIRQITASVNFFHRLFGFNPPAGKFLDGLVNEYVLKFSKKPERKREPILVSHLEAVLNHFCLNRCSLYWLRSLGILITAFFGFLRYSDFCSLKFEDIAFKEEGVEIAIRKSKTDRFGLGQKNFFDQGSFPAKFLHVYFKRFDFKSYAGKISQYVFMSMKRNSCGNCMIFRNEKMSYSSCSRVVKQLFSEVGIPGKFIKLHSLRIGGATEASRLGVPDFKIGLNGRWKSDSSRRLYQRDPGLGRD